MQMNRRCILIRFCLAFVFGLMVYLMAVGMTVYDGTLSAIGQMVCGSVLTLGALLAILVVGSPLLISSIWRRWERVWWLSLLITVIGVGSFVASWLPYLRVSVVDPETQQPVGSFQPVLAIGGWLCAMFGIAFCPVIAPGRNRRIADSAQKAGEDSPSSTTTSAGD